MATNDMLVEALEKIEIYAKGIKDRLDSPNYFGEGAPAGLKNGPIYNAAERADFILNCCRDMRKAIDADAAHRAQQSAPPSELTDARIMEISDSDACNPDTGSGRKLSLRMFGREILKAAREQS